MERLASWLARVQGADPLLDEALDDAQREFLLSYRPPEDGAERQYILPLRSARGAGSAAATPDGAGPCGPGGELQRWPSVEAEAFNDPELQDALRAVRARGLGRRRRQPRQQAVNCRRPSMRRSSCRRSLLVPAAARCSLPPPNRRSPLPPRPARSWRTGRVLTCSAWPS